MKVFRPKNKQTSGSNKIKKFIIKILNKVKLGIAIFLDLIDLLLGNIPLLNSIWDIVTFAILYITLNNKNLALFANSELLLPGVPGLGQIDAFLPIATILTLIDVTKSNSKLETNNRKAESKFIEMEEV